MCCVKLFYNGQNESCQHKYEACIIVNKSILVIDIDDIDISVGVSTPAEQVLSVGANIVPAWRSTMATNYPIHIYIGLSKSKQNISF